MVRFILVFLLLGLTGYVGAQEIKIEKSTEKIVYRKVLLSPNGESQGNAFFHM